MLRSNQTTHTVRPRTHSTPKSAVAKPITYEKWYKNPELSDITIIYGKQGEKRFAGHRIILCNTSEWFQRACKPWYVEGNQREIQLRDDHPEALEALFEFAYINDYTVSANGDTPTKRALCEMMLHIRVFMVADKYMADALAEYCLEKMKELGMNMLRRDDFRCFGSLVMKVYLQGNSFVYDEETVAENRRRDMEDGGVGEEGHGKMTDEIDAVSDEMEDEEERDSDGGYDEDSVKDPIDRIKAALVHSVIMVWKEDDSKFESPDWTRLARKVPEFGSDLGVVAFCQGLTEF